MNDQRSSDSHPVKERADLTRKAGQKNLLLNQLTGCTDNVVYNGSESQHENIRAGFPANQLSKLKCSVVGCT